MKTPEDEAFDDIDRRQRWWGGGFPAKRAMAADKLQEPVAWITPDGEGFRIRFSAPTNDVPLGWDALYTTPPKREWVGLTNNEMWSADYGGSDIINLKYAKAIEAKLKEKNNGT
jgi:hypothetical protein